MPTSWSNRLPASTVTNYNEGTWDDSTLWEGVLIAPTVWDQRTAITSASLHSLIDSLGYTLVDVNGDTLVATSYSAGTAYSSRTIP